MELVVSVTVFAICGDACFNRPIRVYVIERIDKFVTYPLIIIKSEVSTFPIVIYSMVVYLRWLCHHHLSSVTYISPEH